MSLRKNSRVMLFEHAGVAYKLQYRHSEREHWDRGWYLFRRVADMYWVLEHGPATSEKAAREHVTGKEAST